MRIIDADALNIYDISPVDGFAVMGVTEEDINLAPTIDAVEVVRGEWTEREVLEDTVINEWQSARCSECGKYHTTPYMYYFDNFNFCPNCGADMRGKDDE